MKIVMTNDFGEDYVDDLRTAFPQIDFRLAATDADQLREAPGAEVQFGVISREVFLASRGLRWFHFNGIGFDIIVRNIPEFVESDVVLTNCRETHVIPMADHVFAMILAFAHCVPELLQDQRAHRWDPPGYRSRMQELAGTTLGLLALGDIGRAVARRAQGFDMEVYAVDIRQMTPPPGVREVWGAERLDELMARSDWLVVTAPLTDLTRGLIDRSRLEKLKPGAHIVVVSRGGIVEEEALAEGLRSGRICGAGLDAVAPEPLSSDSPLWDMPNVILSPHVSADSAQMWERRKGIFKENLRRYLEGEELLYVCDKKVGY